MDEKLFTPFKLPKFKSYEVALNIITKINKLSNQKKSMEQNLI